MAKKTVKADNVNKKPVCAMIVKYTICDGGCIESIKKLFTDESVSYSGHLHKPDNDIYVSHMTMHMIEGFRKDGWIITPLAHKNNKRKMEVEGIPMDIRANVPNDYDSGVIVRIRYEGETIQKMEANRARTEAKFQRILNKNFIPLDRVCIESSPQCEMLWERNAKPVFGDNIKSVTDLTAFDEDFDAGASCPVA